MASDDRYELEYTPIGYRVIDMDDDGREVPIEEVVELLNKLSSPVAAR